MMFAQKSNIRRHLCFPLRDSGRASSENLPDLSLITYRVGNSSPRHVYDRGSVLDFIAGKTPGFFGLNEAGQAFVILHEMLHVAMPTAAGKQYVDSLSTRADL